jgi:hypothetical protein
MARPWRSFNRARGVARSELLRLLRGRGFNARDSKELKAAMDTISEVVFSR